MSAGFTLSAEQLEQLLLAAIGEYQQLLLNGICEAEARQLAADAVREAARQTITTRGSSGASAPRPPQESSEQSG